MLTLQTVQVTSGIVAQIPHVPDDWFVTWEMTGAPAPNKDDEQPADEAGDLGTLGDTPEGKKLRAFMRSR